MYLYIPYLYFINLHNNIIYSINLHNDIIYSINLHSDTPVAYSVNI